jgi:S1-C subfamily serine protease
MHDVDPTPAAAAPSLESSPLPPDSFTTSLSSLPAVVEPPPEHSAAPAPAHSAAPARAEGPRLAYFLMSLSILLGMGLLAFYAGPWLFLRWRVAQAQADADAIYLRRTAELKAEADAADKRLVALDSKMNLVSLGFREVSRKVAPSVVNVINEYEADEKDAASAFLPRSSFFDPRVKAHFIQEGVGAGLLVRPGFVLTNYHVVRNSAPKGKNVRLRVTFANDDWVTVDLKQGVSTDVLTDLAIVRLPLDGDQSRRPLEFPAVFADSDKDVQVGDWALAVGSPLGLRQTVTAGIISAKGRLLSQFDLTDMIQTDAAINPGNSGGPLFDQFGRVVGINTAIASETGRNQGIGFAIPSNSAREICDQLIEKGEVVRGFIGVGMRELSDKEMVDLNVDETGGILVSEVRKGKPAQKAGIRVGDVLVRFDGRPVGVKHTMRQLRQWILQTPPGTVVPIDIVRRGEPRTVELTVAKRPNES